MKIYLSRVFDNKIVIERQQSTNSIDDKLNKTTMARKNLKSIKDLEIDLQTIIHSYERDGFNINIMKETYKEWAAAYTFIRRNKKMKTILF